MNNNIKLYRRRLVPNENILLKDDVVIMNNENYIVTKWNVLKPRTDFDNGYSIYDFENNIKATKQFLGDKFIGYYFDIINLDKDGHNYYVIDLLVDVIIRDNIIKVVDLDEFQEAMGKGLITPEKMCEALKITNDLLCELYENSTKKYDDIFDTYTGT